MAVFEVISPKGKKIKIEGEQFPTEKELDEIFRKADTPAQSSKRLEGGISKSIDLTPSGIFKSSLSAIETPPTLILNAIANAVYDDKDYEMMEKISGIKYGKKTINPAKVYSEIRESKNNPVTDTVVDLLVYSALPVGKGKLVQKIGVNAAEGGLVSLLESLASKGVKPSANLKDAGFGAAVGGALPGVERAFGIAARAGGNVAQRWSGMPKKFIDRAIKPNSKALDIDRRETSNILSRISSDLRNNYEDIEKKYDKKVVKAIRNLSTDRAVKARDLKKSLDEIYGFYAASGKDAGDLYKYLGNMIDEVNKPVINPKLIGREKEIVETFKIPLEAKQKNLKKKDFINNVFRDKKEIYLNNKYNNQDVNFSKNSLKKMYVTTIDNLTGASAENQLSKDALDKLYDDTKTIALNASELYPQALPIIKHRDFKRNNEKIERYGLPVEIDGDLYNVMLTTKGPNDKGFDILYDIKSKKKTAGSNSIVAVAPIHYRQSNTSIADLIDFVKSNIKKYETDAIPAKNLYGMLKNVSAMGGENSNKFQGDIEKQILDRVYESWINKLSGLSPELKEASESFSNIRNFQKNEEIRKLLKPKKSESQESAFDVLRKYNNSKMGKSEARNLQDLDNLMKKEGYRGFIDDVEDINAVESLNAAVKDNILGKAARESLFIPSLRSIREFNRVVDPLKNSRAAKNFSAFRENTNVISPLWALSERLRQIREQNEKYY